MCGIAGILFKKPDGPGIHLTTGEALTEMMDAVLHRGPDSAGWALYKEPLEGGLRLRFLLEGPQGTADTDKIRRTLVERGAKIEDEETVGVTYAVTITYDGDVQELSPAQVDAGVALVGGRAEEDQVSGAKV